MATPADADIALKLYELRREEVMREARHFVGFEFWPTTADEFKQIHAPGNPKNAYWRQVISYWEMAAQLALHGSIDTDLYMDTQGEGMFLRAKFAELSEQATGNPFMPSTLKLIQSKDAYQAKYDAVARNVAGMRTRMAAAKS